LRRSPNTSSSVAILDNHWPLFGRVIWKTGGWLLAVAVALVGFYAWVTSHITFRP
jgi:hypothetical protein